MSSVHDQTSASLWHRELFTIECLLPIDEISSMSLSNGYPNIQNLFLDKLAVSIGLHGNLHKA
jgi:hypothetical protein